MCSVRSSEAIHYWLEPGSFLTDVRSAVRQLRKSPGFAIVAVVTLALGIGANTAVFSVMNAVLLRFLPVTNPQQLVYLHGDNQPWGTSQSGYGDTSLPLPVYEQLRTQHHVFAQLIALAPLSAQKTSVRFGAEPEEALGEMVSGNFFTGLGVTPLLGRGFTEDDEANHTLTAVLSYSWWTRRFGRDPAVLGQTLYVKGVPFTIVGVAPPGFQGADAERGMEFWIPLQNRPELNPWDNSATEHTIYGSPEWYFLLLVGRLQPGLSWTQALAETQAIYQRAAYAGVKHPDPKEAKPRLYFSSVRGIEDFRDDYQRPLRFLMAMVILVLIIACANVAMLVVARNSRRQREFAVRLAMGAGRARLFRQLLAESLFLVTLGAILGWTFAVFATRALAQWSGLTFSVAPDHRVLFFTVVVSALAALLFGITPLRAATGVPVNATLKVSAATSSADRRQFLGRRLVMIFQISLCLILVVAAGLLFRTLHNLRTSDLGMHADGLLVFGLELPKGIESNADGIRFHSLVFSRLRTLPGVEDATMMYNRLGSGWSNNTAVMVDGHSPPSDRRFAPVRWNAVGPGYLHVLGIPLLLGRDITDDDTPTSQKVAIVNQTFVERYLPHTNPLGHEMSLHGEEDATGLPWRFTIVGVAKNSRLRAVREKPWPIAYVPFSQQSAGVSEMQYALRTRGDPNALLPDVHRVVHDIDSNLPLKRPMTQRAQFEESISSDLLLANLSIFFGALAALLVAVGLYATLSYRVGRRTSEIGVRMALGARREQVLWMVVRESVFLASAGLALGLPFALLIAHLLRSSLYGLSQADPLTFLASLLSIATIALLAGFIPARRAASLDPVQALRSE